MRKQTPGNADAAARSVRRFSMPAMKLGETNGVERDDKCFVS